MLLALLVLATATALAYALQEWRQPSGTPHRGPLHRTGLALVPLSAVAGIVLGLTAPEGMGGLAQATLAGVLLSFVTFPGALAVLVAEVRVRAARRHAPPGP